MNRILKVLRGTMHSSPEIIHFLVPLLGLALAFSGGVYHELSVPVQILILVIYLTFLVGIAPLPMPVFSNNFWQVLYMGLVSGVLDSFVLLAQVKPMEAVYEDGQKADERDRLKLLSLLTLSALIGGLIVWFGEVYAAGLYTNDGRTAVLSALFILPPVLVFLCILGFHAFIMKVSLTNRRVQSVDTRNLREFIAGIVALLVTHDPIVCTGVLFVYVFATRQIDHLLDQVIKNEVEWGVIIVIVLAIAKGSWLVTTVFEPMGLAAGNIAPIIPAGIQAVLWGPLYTDPEVHFWIRLTNLSTGALLLPISSLVGVMLFRRASHWWLYMKYSFPYAVLWFCLMRGWIWLALESSVGRALERFAHSGVH